MSENTPNDRLKFDTYTFRTLQSFCTSAQGAQKSSRLQIAKIDQAALLRRTLFPVKSLQPSIDDASWVLLCWISSEVFENVWWHASQYTPHVFLCCENAWAFLNVIPHLEHLSPSAIFIGFGDTLSATRDIEQSFSCLFHCILCIKDDLHPTGFPRHA